MHSINFVECESGVAKLINGYDFLTLKPTKFTILSLIILSSCVKPDLS